MIVKDNYIILTGAIGAGNQQSSFKLKELGCNCVDEPARIVLEEQRAAGGKGLPEAHAKCFTELMLDKMISNYNRYLQNDELVIFDRGLPDLIGYAKLFNINNELYTSAVNQYRFNNYIFMFRGWEEIYTTDDERKMSYEAAENFGAGLRKIYNDCGYITYEVPFANVNKRAEFIINMTNNIIV